MDPSLVVFDPASNFIGGGTSRDERALLTRLLDMMKSRGTTAIFTSLTHGREFPETTQTEISSMMDTWLLLRDIETDGERNRVLHVLKSRGSNHSNQVREFLLSDEGIRLLDVYTGSGGIALGSARIAVEARDEASKALRQRDRERRERERERRLQALEARIAALRAEYDASEQEAGIDEAADAELEKAIADTVRATNSRRHADRPTQDAS